jgi:hypothetical protein
MAYQQPSHYFSKEEKRTMKKFFKALALVLALVLVIGSLPVMAATDFSLTDDKDGKKIIYIGGANGVDEDGKQCGTKKYYDFTKHIAGFDAETMDLRLKAKDESIVSTKNGSDRVYAKAIGTTDLDIDVYDKEEDRKLGTVKIKVQVKKNADLASFSNIYVFDPQGEPVLDMNKKFGVGQPYVVVLSRKDPVTGAQLDTDMRILTCNDENVVIESLNAPYNTKYAVTFKKAGSYKLHAATIQSKKYGAELLSYDIDVKAGYDAVDVAQSGLDTVDVTFDQVVSGLTGDSFKAYYLIGETKIYPSAANKDVTCNENVATVKFLSRFIGGTEYFVEYEGSVIGSFTAAAFGPDSVTDIEIPTQTFDAGTNAELNYKLLSNGIDIKELLGSTLTGALQFEIENADIDCYITSGSKPMIYIGTADKSYTVKATYSWIDKEGKTQKVEGKGVVASVKPAVWEFKSVTGLVTAGNAADLVKADYSLNGDVKAIKWALGDNIVSGAALQIAVEFVKKDKKVYEGFGATGAEPTIYTSYKAKSADESIVMLKSLDGQKYGLIANKAGSTTILIYGVNGTTETVIGAVPVEVLEARKAASFDVTPSKYMLNKGFAADSIDFTLTLKDQYGDEIKGKTVTVSKVNGDPDFGTDSSKKSGEKFSLVPGAITNDKTGALNLKFACEGLEKVVLVTVGKEDKATSYVLSLSGTSLDTGVKGDTESKSIKVSLAGKANGFDAEGVADSLFTFVGATPTSKATTGTSTSFVYTVAKDGKVVEKASDIKNFAGNTFNSLATSNSTYAAVKMAAGSYTVTAYKVAQDGSNQIVSIIGAANFTVTDNQVQPTWSVRSTAESLTYTADPAVTFGNDALSAKAFEFKVDGADFTVEYNVTPDGTGKTAYVKEAYVTIKNTKDVGFVKVTVAIDKIVKAK